MGVAREGFLEEGTFKVRPDGWIGVNRPRRGRDTARMEPVSALRKFTE